MCFLIIVIQALILDITLDGILGQSFHLQLFEIFIKGPYEIPKLKYVFAGKHHIPIEQRTLEMIVKVQSCLVRSLLLLIAYHRALIPKNPLLQNIALHGVVDNPQTYISQLVLLREKTHLSHKIRAVMLARVLRFQRITLYRNSQPLSFHS